MGCTDVPAFRYVATVVLTCVLCGFQLWAAWRAYLQDLSLYVTGRLTIYLQYFSKGGCCLNTLQVVALSFFLYNPLQQYCLGSGKSGLLGQPGKDVYTLHYSLRSSCVLQGNKNTSKQANTHMHSKDIKNKHCVHKHCAITFVFYHQAAEQQQYRTIKHWK